MCQSGVTCLSPDCCFSELPLIKSNQACWSSTKQTLSSSHWKLTRSRHDIAEKLLSWRSATTTHSLIHSLMLHAYLFIREATNTNFKVVGLTWFNPINIRSPHLLLLFPLLLYERSNNIPQGNTKIKNSFIVSKLDLMHKIDYLTSKMVVWQIV